MANEEITLKEVLDIAVKSHNEGNLPKAKFIYEKILEKYPDNANALHLLGLIDYQEKNYELAVNNIKKAIEVAPENAIFYHNLAMVYDSMGNEEESAQFFKRALEINPNYSEAHVAYYNLGIFNKKKENLQEALSFYNKAIETKKDFADAHWNRALVLLLLGKLKEGFEEFEYRFKKISPTDSRTFGKPKWDGSPLNGKKLLILSEQGFGDTIQFVRYIPLIKEKGAKVILECKKELIELFKNFQGIDEIVEKQVGVPQIEYDYYIHLMSLPVLFKSELDNIPARVPYLKVNRELAKKFKEKLGFDSSKLNVGICWAGNPSQENDKNRSTTFEKFKVLKEISQVKLFSLQKGAGALQLDELEITNLTNEMKDFADTAAIIENLDLVISVDTSIAHLAGALGKKCWTLLTKVPDWRWLLSRNDSSWYPTMRLFRQKTRGDWESLMKEVKDELIKNLREII